MSSVVAQGQRLQPLGGDQGGDGDAVAVILERVADAKGLGDEPTDLRDQERHDDDRVPVEQRPDEEFVMRS
jgi:hypothetical protein